MATYNPQIVISAAPGITDHLYMVLYEATAPNTPVANSGQLAPPHNASRQLQFIGLNPVIHLVNLFVTDGVSTTGTIIANFSIDPKYPGVELKLPWFIYADTEPGFDSGTNVFTDPDGELDGWDYTVDIRGFGLLNPDNEIDTQNPPGYQILITGESGEPYVIQPNELHIIEFAPKTITLNTSTNSGGALFDESIVLTEDTSLAGTDYGKMYIIASDTSTIRITLPEMDSVSANRLFMFTSGIGNHINAVVEVEGSDSEKIEWLNEQLTELILGQSEVLWLFKWVNPDDGNDQRWKVANVSDGPAKVGEIFNYYRNIDLVNAVFADGAELDRDVYPRLWAWVQTLDASMLVSEATWANSDNQGKFSTGDLSTTFRIPLLYRPGFLRGVDGTIRKAGSIEVGQNLVHGHAIRTTNSGASNNVTADAVRGSIVGTVSTRGLPDDSDAGDKTIASSGGDENRPSNHGAYLLIRI